jgi:acetyl esterase/lipase
MPRSSPLTTGAPPITDFRPLSHDAIDAFCAIGARADEFGIDAAKIGVAGMSAGGNLALVTALAFDSVYASQWQSSSVCRRGTRAPKLVVANVAVCDMAFSDRVECSTRDVIGVLNFRTMIWMRLLYAPDASRHGQSAAVARVGRRQRTEAHAADNDGDGRTRHFARRLRATGGSAVETSERTTASRI